MWIYIFFLSFVLFAEVVDMIEVQSDEDKQDRPVLLMKRYGSGLLIMRMTEQNGVGWSFSLLNNIEKLPDISKEEGKKNGGGKGKKKAGEAEGDFLVYMHNFLVAKLEISLMIKRINERLKGILDTNVDVLKNPWKRVNSISGTCF